MPTIKTSDSNAPIDLDSLLSHIRLRGITVGNPEMQRLQAVFAQAPVLSRNELRNLFGALLAKDDWQRQQIGRVFDRLLPFDEEESDKPLPVGQTTPSNTEIKPAASGTDNTEQEEDSEIDVEEPFSWRNLAPKTILMASLAALLVLLIAIVFWAAPPDEPDTKHQDPIKLHKESPKPIEEPKPEPGETPLKLIKNIDHWVPYVESRPRDAWPQLFPVLLLLLGSGLGFSWLFYKVLDASRQQKAHRPKLIKETGRFHVSGVSKPADYHLLNGEQRREMNWGISRYQSEQPLNRLNIPLSVKRSAAAGMPQLAFERSTQEREVWLWQDQSSKNPDLSRLADEIDHTLQRANISVQRGYFRGLPTNVNSAQGEVLWSNRHDYPETEPLVVIFADADNLGQRQLNSPNQSDRTLQQLSHWPLLCFVDSSQQAGTLQRLLQPHELDCVLPQGVAEWLANQGQTKAQSADNCVLDSLHQWATACALPNRVIMEDEIRALHNALGFDCAWHFHALTRYAKVSGRGFDFRAKRTSLLNELKSSIEGSEFVNKAVQFWIARNDDLDKALKTNVQGGSAWESTRKQRLLERDTALLKLWFGFGKPTTKRSKEFKETVKTLYDLYAHKSLRKDISRELSHYSCSAFKSSDVMQGSATSQIILPFAWNDPDLGAETQRQLLHCGFGGQPDPDVTLRWDNATRGILAGLAAIMLLSVLTSANLLMPKSAKIVTQLDSAEPPKNTLIPPKQGDNYLAGTYKSIGRAYKPENHKSRTDNEVITVRWRRQAAQAAQFPIDEERPDTSPQHWLLGTVAKPTRPKPTQGAWPDLSIVVIFGDAKDMTVRTLAAKLLDTGSADQVLIGSGRALRKQHQQLLKQSALIQDSQWIYINGPMLDGHHKNQRVASIKLTPAKVLSELRQSNDLFAVTQLENTTTKTPAKSPLLQAKKQQRADAQIKLGNNLILVKIPQGSFQMGSKSGGSSEKPVHTVSFDYDFWMSQTEVTFEQYDAYIADIRRQANSPVKTQVPTVPEVPKDEGWGRDQRPVMNVNWNDAQAYVKWLSATNPEGLQCRLPSEAEWEYAARAGTETVYPWGDEVGKNNANCDGCGSEWDKKQTAPVGSFKPNAFGLHDMHGNVWEWVQDSYHDSYQGAPANGEAWEGNDGSRVLRGGSWLITPNYLRSADRNDVTPDDRFSVIGFRIVCSSH